MNITQNHGFAIRVWTMVWHRLSVKINISCLCPIEIYLNIIRVLQKEYGNHQIEVIVYCENIPRHLVASNIGFLLFASIFQELLTENIK